MPFFDAEEPPYYLSERMGSVRWYLYQRERDVHARIAMDLVGHDVSIPGREDSLFITGMESDADLAGVLRPCEPQGGIRIIPTFNRYVGDVSDHQVFGANRRLYLFLVRPSGSLPQLDEYPGEAQLREMAAIGDFLVDAIERVSRAASAGPFEGYDSTETELYFLKRAAGRLFEASASKTAPTSIWSETP